jgi:hypothetical protein
MVLRPRFPLVFVVAVAGFAAAVVNAQRRDAFVLSRDHPAVRYTNGDLDNPIVRLNERLAKGEVRLSYDPDHGYLRSLLDALSIPVSSQSLVFSKTSFQADLITMHNPRAIFFGDSVFVAWVRGADVLEIAAADRRQGSVFYTLTQKAPGESDAPVTLERKNDCLACHLSWDTRGVPGLLTTSMYPLPDDPNAYANGFTTVQGSPLEQRWGGWWVTGDTGGAQHLGNIPVMPAEKNFGRPRNPKAPLASVEGFFDLKGYPTATSDVVAQLTLAHETQLTNLIARRVGGARGRRGGVGRRERAGARSGAGTGRRAALPRRGAAARAGARVAGVCGLVHRPGATRCQRTLAPRFGSANPSSAVSAELPDLRRGVQGAAGLGTHSRVRPPVGRALGPRYAEDHPAPDGRRPSGDPPDPA